MYFDSHTHLNHEDLYANRQKHLKEFIKAWWIWLVNIGVNHEYNTRGIQICKSLENKDDSPIIWATTKSGRYPKTSYEPTIAKEKDDSLPQVYCTIGLHPCEVVAGTITESSLYGAMREMCSLYSPYKEFIVGIGECGIDTHQEWSETSLEIQKDLFWQQCDLARQWDLPIVIHSRWNREATHAVLKNFKDLTIYFHCRSYTPAEIKVIKEKYSKFYIGFCGNISYPKAEDIRKSLRYLVHENENYPEHIISWKISEEKIDNWKLIISNLLIETDAPYLAPQSHRGQSNSPALIGETYTYISQLLGQDITSQVVENARKCYGI